MDNLTEWDLWTYVFFQIAPQNNKNPEITKMKDVICLIEHFIIKHRSFAIILS